MESYSSCWENSSLLISLETVSVVWHNALQFCLSKVVHSLFAVLSFSGKWRKHTEFNSCRTLILAKIRQDKIFSLIPKAHWMTKCYCNFSLATESLQVCFSDITCWRKSSQQLFFFGCACGSGRSQAKDQTHATAVPQAAAVTTPGPSPTASPRELPTTLKRRHTRD